MGRAYDIVIYHGKKMDRFTKQRLQAAERRLGYDLSIVQGSYNTGVAASAGTHDGGGALDLLEWDWRNKCRALRKEGFAAWHRPAIPGLWGGHIHAILYDNTRLSSGARSQVTQYYQHRNGLASWDWDPQWRPDPLPHFKYRRKPKRPKLNLRWVQNSWARKNGRVYNPWGRKANRQWNHRLKKNGFIGKQWWWKRASFDRKLRNATRRANEHHRINEFTGPKNDRPTWKLAKKLGFDPYKKGPIVRPGKGNKKRKRLKGFTKTDKGVAK